MFGNGSLELLPNGTWIYQTDDGTHYYWYFNIPMRLYVKLNGQDMDAELPGESIACIATCGNAIYFYSDRKVYKAIYSASDGISVLIIRDMFDGEEFCSSGPCSRLNHKIYNLWDDPDTDGIDVSELKHEDLKLRRIHRGKAIYTGKIDLPENFHVSSVIFPKARTIGERVIVIEAPTRGSVIYSNDSSPFVYISSSNIIHVLDTSTMEFMPPMIINGFDGSCFVAGEYNGYFSLIFEKGDRYCLMISRLLNEKSEGAQIQFESTFLKEFKPRRILGQGSFGCVFETQNIMDELIYAVKRIPINRGDEMQTALSEVRMMAQLDHPGIIRYHHTWMENPPPGAQMKVDYTFITNLGESSCNYVSRNEICKTAYCIIIPCYLFLIHIRYCLILHNFRNLIIHSTALSYTFKCRYSANIQSIQHITNQIS
ncbi:hypothetical protein PMAYCL1PPCAC_09585 [Pristionchus mayeri]|uniref:Protein kinase domain-containing protein n=1 Tax=Pristionchus mayeri TaxID=1317129 RepID=A0AAN4ZLW1_9BILA|nr:hypothetical protein PMAYCL1PPCAC_09585 [Pristionchus mayeri]